MDNKIEKQFHDILLEALKFEETGDTEDAIKTTNKCIKLAHDLITIAEMFG